MMESQTPKLQELLEYVGSGDRVCPQPLRWNQLWEMLPDRRRVGNGWEPPLPLILGAWWHTTPRQKMMRLRKHIEYAEAKGALSEVDNFLRSLPEEDWLYIRQD